MTATTPDVATAVKNAKAGQVQYRTDKAGIVHASIGRASFDAAKIKRELGWEPAHTFERGIRETVQWYLANQAWTSQVKQAGAAR